MRVIEYVAKFCKAGVQKEFGSTTVRAVNCVQKQRSEDVQRHPRKKAGSETAETTTRKRRFLKT